MIEMGMGKDNGGQRLSLQGFGDPASDPVALYPDTCVDHKGILIIPDKVNIASS
jgi:hypothetical protein